MIPRSLGLFAKSDRSGLPGGFLGVLVLLVVLRFVAEPFHLQVDGPAWRAANGLGLAGACTLFGAVLGLLPSWLWKPAIITAATLHLLMYLVTLPFHEVDKYVSTVHMLLTLPPLIIGTLTAARLRSTRASAPAASAERS